MLGCVAALQKWAAAGKRAVWMRVHLSRGSLVPIAINVRVLMFDCGYFDRNLMFRLL
jgi:hypothetical protein